MNKLPLTKQNHFFRLWLMAIIAICALVVSACGGTIQNLPTPTLTPTPTVESGEPVESVEPVGPGESSAVETATPPSGIPTNDPNLEPTETLQVEDICSLVTAFDVENVLGETVTSMTSGTDLDDVSDSTINYCTFKGSDKAVVISSVEVENSFLGLDMMRSYVKNNQDEEPDTKTLEELGVGVQAFWSVSDHGGSYTVLTEAHIFSVGLGGNIGDPENHKADLLTLAQILAEKL